MTPSQPSKPHSWLAQLSIWIHDRNAEEPPAGGVAEIVNALARDQLALHEIIVAAPASELSPDTVCRELGRAYDAWGSMFHRWALSLLRQPPTRWGP